MKVSIITVTFNSVKTLERTILSVISQKYDNIEYIIVDGNSIDGTIDIIKKYQKNITKWISEPDLGLYDAMNKGIRMATGEIIGIINSDDCYHSNETITNIVSYYNEIGNKSIVHGNCQYHHEDGRILIGKPKSDPTFIKRGPYVFHPTMFVPKDFYDKIGVFNLEYKIAADYDLILRLYMNSCPFVYIDEIITDMYAGGVSDKKIIKGFKECRKIMIRNGINPILSTIYFLKRLIGAKLLKK